MSQQVSNKEIAQVVLQMAASGVRLRKLARELAAYLVTEQRTKDSNAILRDLLHLRVESGVAEANSISVHKLSEKLRREIGDVLKQEYPKGTNILLHEEHDPELIGGVRVTAPDVQLDLSIKHRLQQLVANVQGT